MNGLVYIRDVSTLSLDNDKCTGCGRCIEVCPHGVLEIVNKKALIQDIDRCMECGACKQNCAFQAIKVNSGVGCAAAIITGFIRNTEPECGCSDDSGSKGCC